SPPKLLSLRPAHILILLPFWALASPRPTGGTVRGLSESSGPQVKDLCEAPNPSPFPAGTPHPSQPKLTQAALPQRELAQSPGRWHPSPSLPTHSPGAGVSTAGRRTAAPWRQPSPSGFVSLQPNSPEKQPTTSPRLAPAVTSRSPGPAVCAPAASHLLAPVPDGPLPLPLS
uniref:Uncharacterized protein n=1 Tax=Marmota marmota marmota TaxID=9994 RepID=A0A8C5Z974_MARMA